MSLLVRKLRETAVVPHRPPEGGVSYFEVYSADTHDLAPDGGRAVVGTGVSLRLPDGTHGRLEPVPSLAAAHGVGLLAGDVAGGATGGGEMRVVLVNHGDEPVRVTPGTCVARLVIERVLAPRVVASLASSSAS